LSQSKSFAVSLHVAIPSLTTIRRCSFDLWLHHQSTSFATHLLPAASEDATRMRNLVDARARWIAAQSEASADKLAVSRNTRSARSRYHERANPCDDRCRMAATRASPAWLHEMNASYPELLGVRARTLVSRGGVHLLQVVTSFDLRPGLPSNGRGSD